MSDFSAACEAYRRRAEHALSERLPAATEAPRLRQAMAYACLNGGKRVRAMLVYACGEQAGAAAAALDAAAAAVEMMHAYSLVHDDLPAMDDDALRRGRPTCHLVYGEATAILAGDALQTRAFEILSADAALNLPPTRRLRMVETLARAAGADGMVGGQALDIEAGGDLQITQLARMHRLKTGALIRAAARLGALAGVAPFAPFAPAHVNEHVDTHAQGEPSRAADEETHAHRTASQPADSHTPEAATLEADATRTHNRWLARVDDYAADLGLAFQIVDDLLDEGEGGAAFDAGSAESAARNTASTVAAAASIAGNLKQARPRGGEKTTYVSLLGRARARAEAEDLSRRAVQSAAALGDNSQFLEQLARFVVQRTF